ncbi:MAG: TonB family protein [Bacteroidales bacterium]|nr:TonB family protein [Bacteroidales bacterium]
MTDYFKKHKTGIIGTIIFHFVIGAIFMFFGYSTPLPLPDEEGILINFGDSDEGFGQTEPQYSESVQQESVEESQESVPETTTSPTDDGSITQDYEEAPTVNEQGNKEKEESETETKPEPEKEEKTEVIEERKVNEQALFPGRDRNNNTSSSEGETQGQDNQGSTTGSVDSQNHVGGNSKGTSGTSFSLAGRNPESLPKPEYNYQIEGKVVVEITVDKYGNVTDAVPGVKGSTTLDANLLSAAKKAALKAKFDKKPDAPAYQKGTITYFFRLQ